ncbi:hypothetical protein JOM56_003120 [Amanita muscaria]
MAMQNLANFGLLNAAASPLEDYHTNVIINPNLSMLSSGSRLDNQPREHERPEYARENEEHKWTARVGHVLLTLDSDGIGGRNLVAWGKNLDGELENGKKASVGVPKTMEGEDGERLMLVSKKTGAVRIEQRPAASTPLSFYSHHIPPSAYLYSL